jgi:hypothetical protein
MPLESHRGSSAVIPRGQHHDGLDAVQVYPFHDQREREDHVFARVAGLILDDDALTLDSATEQYFEVSFSLVETLALMDTPVRTTV